MIKFERRRAGSPNSGGGNEKNERRGPPCDLWRKPIEGGTEHAQTIAIGRGGGPRTGLRVARRRAAEKLKIGFLPGVVDPFYQVMQLGVEKAAKDLGIEVVTQIPPTWGVSVQTPILELDGGARRSQVHHHRPDR